MAVVWSLIFILVWLTWQAHPVRFNTDSSKHQSFSVAIVVTIVAITITVFTIIVCYPHHHCPLNLFGGRLLFCFVWKKKLFAFLYLFTYYYLFICKLRPYYYFFFLLYITSPGTKSCQTELVPKSIKKSTPLTLNRPKNLSSTTSGNLQKTANVNQNTTCNDVIDLKSTRVTSASPSLLPQPWNLPMRNSFTSYAKPLPAVPKVPYQ